MKRPVKIAIIVFLVLLLDQTIKIWVKTHMSYGDEIKMLGLDWALIHFVENNGMAFGFSLGGAYGKLVLSLFRILAVGFLVYYIRFLILSKANFGLLVSFALILAGALGNILDSAFYGMIFSESPYHGGVAQLFPEGGGYSGFLHGKVVDMMYFPMFKGIFPDWMPFWAGEPYLFFKPVFNIADMAITTGVLNILIFQRSFFSPKKQEETQATVDEPTLESSVINVEEGENNHQENGQEPSSSLSESSEEEEKGQN